MDDFKDAQQPITVAEDPNTELLTEIQKDFERVKRQKCRPTGGVEGWTMMALCFLNDEVYVDYRNRTLSLEPRDNNKLYLNFNLIVPRYNKLMGRLSAFNAPFKAQPNKKDPQALEEAEIVDRMIIALGQKLDDPSRLREIFHWLLSGGTVIVHTPWIPNATIEPNPQFDESGNLLYRHLATDGIYTEQDMISMVNSGLAPEEFEIYEEVEQVGEVGCEVLSPFNVFIDQTVRSIEDLPPDAWVHIAQIRTLGWIKENFQVDIEAQKDISLVTSKIQAEGVAAGGLNLKDLIPLIQGSADDSDPDMAVVVQSYQPASTDHPKGRYVCWVPDQEILHDADNPYEEIPLVDIHFGPVATSFWTRAYITSLIAPQRFINKRMSQLGEQANAAVYALRLLGGGLKASDIPADYPGIVENGQSETGTPNVINAPPPELPTWFLPSIELAVKMFNDAAGGADLMEDNKFPGQLRGPLAVPMLQEILDTQWGPLFSHLGERLSRIHQMRLNRVKQFYPPLRTMHYTDRAQKDEVMMFHTDKILRSGTNYNITVQRGSLLPELRALRESRITERLSGPLAILYMDERTGRLDKTKIAADLQFGDTGREGRESRYRKLGQEIAKMLWENKPVPPVQPFYDHVVMLDELENEMATTEYLKASPQVQQKFAERWQQHSVYLQQEAQAQQMAMQSGMIQNAVAQATQQAAAQAAADAVDMAMAQTNAQKAQPTGQYVEQAAQRAHGGPANRQSPPSRKITYEERNDSNGPAQR